MAVPALGAAACNRAEPAAQSRSLFDVGLMRVEDRANVLSGTDEIELVRRSEALEKATSDQLAVVTLPTLNGRPIEEKSLALARGAGLGRAELDNGVLLLVAPNERKVRIEVGLGLEALLTDARAGEIVRGMLPHFRRGDIPAGVRTGTDQISVLLMADRKRPRYRNEERRRIAA
jgi:uncharacterized protein